MMKYTKIIIVCLFVVMTTNAQDNNSSITEELKSIWNRDNSIQGDLYPIDIAATEASPGLGGGSDGPNDVPIDGGLGFLLAAGIGYAANGMRKRRKKENQEGAEEKENKI
jgi:hypothetical protein